MGKKTSNKLSKSQIDKIKLKKVMGNDHKTPECKNCKFFDIMNTKTTVVIWNAPSALSNIPGLNTPSQHTVNNYYKNLFQCAHPDFQPDKYHNEFRKNQMLDEVLKYKYCHNYESE